MRKHYLPAAAAAVALLGTAFVVDAQSTRAAQPGGDARGGQLERALAATGTDLRTPFETSNGARWTSLPEAQQFRRALAEGSDRVRLQRVGTSTDGHPIQLVSVGYPRPKPRPQAAKGSVALFDCSIHGNEPAGREACLQMARDMAGTDNPTWKRFLRRTTVLFVNINPDGWVRNTRGNADGTDVNRDFAALATPEARALARVIRDWNPDMLNDLHEYGPRQYYKTDVLQLWPRNRNVDPTIHRLSKSMVRRYAAPQVTSHDGYTAGTYGVLVKNGTPFRQIAGDGQVRILRNYVGLQHVTGMLTETATGAIKPEERGHPKVRNRRRVTVEYASATGTLQYVLEHRAQLARQSRAAAERATRAGAERSGLVYFAGQDNVLPSSSDGVEPQPMCGYRLSRDQWSPGVRRTLRHHDIAWQRDRSGVFVPMAQPQRGLVPLLLDGRSEYGLIDATPVQIC